MHQATQVMDRPPDLISAAVEVLLKEQCELPAFSTLDRMATRIRRLVNDGVYRTILDRLSEAEQQALERLLEPEPGSLVTDFNRIKEAPKSATLTHLDEWLSRLCTGSSRLVRPADTLSGANAGAARGRTRAVELGGGIGCGCGRGRKSSECRHGLMGFLARVHAT